MILGNNHPLQLMFYGTFVEPPIAKTHKYRIGFCSAPKYVPPVAIVKPPKDPNKLTLSEESILKILQRSGKDTTPMEIAAKVKMTKNHCGMVMASLFKRGLLTRFKVSEGNVRYYKYKAKS